MPWASVLRRALILLQTGGSLEPLLIDHMALGSRRHPPDNVITHHDQAHESHVMITHQAQDILITINETVTMS